MLPLRWNISLFFLIYRFTFLRELNRRFSVSMETSVKKRKRDHTPSVSFAVVQLGRGLALATLGCRRQQMTEGVASQLMFCTRKRLIQQSLRGREPLDHTVCFPAMKKALCQNKELSFISC